VTIARPEQKKPAGTRYTTPAENDYQCDATHTPHPRLLTGRRSPTPGIPEDVGRILMALGHPNRLLILIALEERPRSLQELIADLGLKPDPARHAIKQLRAAGLIHVAEERRTHGNLVGHVYGTPCHGWSQILDAVAAVAASG
jgi:DNA-binding transcriptional ArsR family regulator